MRPLIKTANRIDNVWTGFVMLPALIVLLNVGIALNQGTATPAQFASAANEVAIKFTGQYTPYIETTSAAMLNVVTKLASVAGSCIGQSSGPVYTNPAMAHARGCSLSTSALATFPALKKL